jgi:hypothetical protein
LRLSIAKARIRRAKMNFVIFPNLPLLFLYKKTTAPYRNPYGAVVYKGISERPSKRP